MSQTSPTQTPAKQSGTLLVVAIVVAVAAVILVNLYIANVRKASKTKTFVLYRLVSPAQPGDKLSDRDLKAYNIPVDFIDAFPDRVKPAPDGKPGMIGELFKRSAQRGEILSHSMFFASDDNRIDRKITDGMRLVALPVNAKHLPGILNYGMFVDIEAPFSSDDGVPRVLPVMERVKVIAVGAQSVVDEYDSDGSSRRRSNFSTISIEVEPNEATQLSMIKKIATGDFELHLRRPGDDALAKITGGGINPQVLELINVTPDMSLPR